MLIPIALVLHSPVPLSLTPVIAFALDLVCAQESDECVKGPTAQAPTMQNKGSEPAARRGTKRSESRSSEVPMPEPPLSAGQSHTHPLTHSLTQAGRQAGSA